MSERVNSSIFIQVILHQSWSLVSYRWAKSTKEFFSFQFWKNQTHRHVWMQYAIMHWNAYENKECVDVATFTSHVHMCTAMELSTVLHNVPQCTANPPKMKMVAYLWNNCAFCNDFFCSSAARYVFSLMSRRTCIFQFSWKGFTGVTYLRHKCSQIICEEKNQLCKSWCGACYTTIIKIIMLLWICVVAYLGQSLYYKCTKLSAV